MPAGARFAAANCLTGPTVSCLMYCLNTVIAFLGSKLTENAHTKDERAEKHFSACSASNKGHKWTSFGHYQGLNKENCYTNCETRVSEKDRECKVLFSKRLNVAVSERTNE